MFSKIKSWLWGWQVLPALLVAVWEAALCTYLEPLQDHNWCCWAWTGQAEPSCWDTGHLRRNENSSFRHAVNMDMMLFWEQTAENYPNTSTANKKTISCGTVFVTGSSLKLYMGLGEKGVKCWIVLGNDDLIETWPFWLICDLKSTCADRLSSIALVWCLGSGACGWLGAHPRDQEALTVLYFNTHTFQSWCWQQERQLCRVRFLLRVEIFSICVNMPAWLLKNADMDPV